MGTDKEEVDKNQLMEKMFGITMPDPSSYETRIGNTRHSDFEFLRQLQDNEKIKKRMDSAAYADDLYDVADTTLDMMGDESEDKKVSDYQAWKIPSSDYTDPYPPYDSTDDTKEITQNQINMATNKEEFEENKEDITKTDAEETSKIDQFRENAESANIPIAEKEDIRKDFRENGTEITGNEISDASSDASSDNSGDEDGGDDGDDDSDDDSSDR